MTKFFCTSQSLIRSTAALMIRGKGQYARKQQASLLLMVALSHVKRIQ